MKIRVRRTFRYQATPQEVREIQPGIHDLSPELAAKVLKYGKAEKVFEKVAPENKAIAVTENKSGLERAVRGRGKRAKPDA